MYNVQFTMHESKLNWKHHGRWVCDLNAISIHKSLKFVTYFRPMVDNPLSPVASPTYMIDTFVWSILKSLELKF